MFEEEIKNLSTLDRYIINHSDLSDSYLFALGAYKSGCFKIEFENVKNTQYYLDDIATHRNRLINRYEYMKMLKSEIDINTLDAFYKKKLESDNVFFDKIQILLNDMEQFLSKHNNNNFNC